MVLVFMVMDSLTIGIFNPSKNHLIKQIQVEDAGIPTGRFPPPQAVPRVFEGNSQGGNEAHHRPLSS